MKGLIAIEKKGDVTFYEDAKGNMYQQLGNDDIFKVRNGSITYRLVTKVNGHEIKYNNNGIYGFAIFKGRVCIEDRFWVYEEVLRAVNNM